MKRVKHPAKKKRKKTLTKEAILRRLDRVIHGIELAVPRVICPGTEVEVGKAEKNGRSHDASFTHRCGVHLGHSGYCKCLCGHIFQRTER